VRGSGNIALVLQLLPLFSYYFSPKFIVLIMCQHGRYAVMKGKKATSDRFLFSY
jgi:hypothetical protein